jgi:hypothetical protein
VIQLAAVRRLQPKNVAAEGNRIIVDVAEPLGENPDLVQAVVSAGSRIQLITSLSPDLEETYLRIVKETPEGVDT